MNWTEKKSIRIAILDLYEGHTNQGMRCIREILNQFGESNHLDLNWDEFEVRLEKQVPDLSYDIYISSGGPGSPLESEGSDWEKVYFNWLKKIEQWNNNAAHVQKKQVFFICHSFQLICRHYDIARVSRRKSTAFGIFPTHLLSDGKDEVIFNGLKDPFYSVDSRDYQVIEPNHNKLHKMGASILAIEKDRPHVPLERAVMAASILAIEKDRPHVPLERAVMAIRFNENMIGTQFHPEADAIGMSLHLQTPEKKKTVIENYGIEKWQSMIDHLNDPEKIMWTYSHILPNFLLNAVESLQPVEV